MKQIFVKKFLLNLILNLLTFFLLSVIVTILSLIVPDYVFTKKSWILKERKWEQKGEFYQKYFKVRLWKNHLPELGDFIRGIFPKKKIMEFSDEYLRKYLFESRKSELTHWCIILSSLLFILWNEPHEALLMFIIAAVINLPYIIIQRYNRPRIAEAIGIIDERKRHILA